MEQFGYFEDFLEKFGSLGQHKDRISQFTVSKDIHKSAAIATLQTNDENKSRFPKSFWFEGSEN